MLVANGIDPALITVFPFGIDTFGPRSARSPRPEAGRLRVGFVGEINRAKALHVLLEAFGKPPKTAVSPSGSAGACKRTRPGCAPRVPWLGTPPRCTSRACTQTRRWPTSWERWVCWPFPGPATRTPLVIYSALAEGVPVLTSDLGSMSEVVHPGVPRGLKRQLGRLVDEPGFLERLRENTGDVRTF